MIPFTRTWGGAVLVNPALVTHVDALDDAGSTARSRINVGPHTVIDVRETFAEVQEALTYGS